MNDQPNDRPTSDLVWDLVKQVQQGNLTKVAFAKGEHYGKVYRVGEMVRVDIYTKKGDRDGQ